MKKRITEYLAYIDALLEKEDVDWEHEKEKHLVQIALLVLLIPYVMHYYLLENSVQKMYEQYDRMMNKIEPSFQVKPDDKK